LYKQCQGVILSLEGNILGLDPTCFIQSLLENIVLYLPLITIL